MLQLSKAAVLRSGRTVKYEHNDMKALESVLTRLNGTHGLDRCRWCVFGWKGRHRTLLPGDRSIGKRLMSAM